MSHLLTGNKDVDTKILSLLDTKDLLSFSHVDSFASQLYLNENFWRNKFANKYFVTGLSNDLYLPKYYTWRKLYQNLETEFTRNLEGNFTHNNFNLVFLDSIIFKKLPLTKILLKDPRLRITSLITQFIVNYDYIEFVELVLTDALDLLKNDIQNLFTHWKYSNGNIKILEMLLKAGVEIKTKDLLFLIENGKKKSVSYILSLKSLNFVSDSSTILQEGALYFERTGDYDMLSILLNSYLNDSWKF